MQTGFPSPATHYLEKSIDLSEVLIDNREASFFVRIGGNSWENLNIHKKDVLIIDRSVAFTRGKLALVIKEGNFDIIAYPSYKNADEGEVIELWGVITYIIHKV